MTNYQDKELSGEQERALEDAHCVAAANAYFGARSHLMDTTANRNIFDAGFKAAYRAASPQLPVAQTVQAVRPSDDELWDQTLQERDKYHEVADDLAAQIAAITGEDIGEHSSANDPWRNAMLAADEFIAIQIRQLCAPPTQAIAVEAVQGILQIMGNITTLEPDNELNNFPMALLISFDNKADIKKAIADGFAKFDFAPSQGAKQ